MKDLRDPVSGLLLPDEERLTSAGRFIRDWSLDELPQFWNVIVGDISLVGPRPLLAEYLQLYSPWQARRHEVKPGITGWAQINGRNSISWDEKFELDVWYVDNWSLRLDVTILVRTILRVFRREGISASGHATITRFAGASTVRDMQSAELPANQPSDFAKADSVVSSRERTPPSMQ